MLSLATALVNKVWEVWKLLKRDANGNMTVIDGLTNTWDFKDRLVAVENAEMRAAYTYDYTDRRILKQVWPKPSTPNQQPALNCHLCQ